MNIILATESLPASLSCARVAFLPKAECPEDPSNFRPIAISSVLACALHKVFSRRMREGFQSSPLQYAFLQRDSCLEASSLLHALLRCTHDETRPLAVAFLDLTKAFDAISHQAILAAAEKAGTPPPLLKYLEHQCINAIAELHLGALATKCSKGVSRGSRFHQSSSFWLWGR